MKKPILWMILALLPLQAAWSDHHEDKAGMEAVKAEFARCMMCKNYLPVFDELMPVLQTEFVQLDTGMIMVHTVADPSKVELLHQTSRKMEETAGTAMQLSDADGKAKLCPMCQEIRRLVQAGAQVSSGLTKHGDVVLLQSSDPAVQKQIAVFRGECEAMMSGGH